MAVFPLVRLLRLVRADWLKTRRTPLRLAVVAAPAACALLLLGYFSRFQASPELPQRMLAAFCEVWTALFPLGMLGLIHPGFRRVADLLWLYVKLSMS